jgi:hypothetical protein
MGDTHIGDYYVITEIETGHHMVFGYIRLRKGSTRIGGKSCVTLHD